MIGKHKKNNLKYIIPYSKYQSQSFRSFFYQKGVYHLNFHFKFLQNSSFGINFKLKVLTNNGKINTRNIGDVVESNKLV